MTNLLPKEELARHEAARTAVVQARKLLRGWTTMARMMARNPKLRVELTGAETSCTDGRTLFIRVPPELQEPLVHDPNLCQRRTEHNVPACHACDVLEDVNIHVIHEVSHVIFGTFEDVTDFEKAQLLQRAIDSEAAGRPDSKRAAAIKARIDNAPPEKKRDYLNMADLVSPWLPFLFNACEDIRVNTLMQKERPGTRKMFDGQMNKIFREGVLRPDGTRFHWNEAPHNAQAAIGVFCKMGGFNWRESLAPEVVEKIDDPDLDALCIKMTEARSARDIYRICYPLLEQLRKLGFMKMPDEPEDEPPTPPTPDEENSADAEEEESQDEPSGDGEGGSQEGDGDSPPSADSAPDEDGSGTDDGGEGDEAEDSGSEPAGSGDDSSSEGERDSADAEGSGDGDDDDLSASGGGSPSDDGEGSDPGGSAGESSSDGSDSEETSGSEPDDAGSDPGTAEGSGSGSDSSEASGDTDDSGSDHGDTDPSEGDADPAADQGGTDGGTPSDNPSPGSDGDVGDDEEAGGDSGPAGSPSSADSGTEDGQPGDSGESQGSGDDLEPSASDSDAGRGGDRGADPSEGSDSDASPGSESDDSRDPSDPSDDQRSGSEDQNLPSGSEDSPGADGDPSDSSEDAPLDGESDPGAEALDGQDTGQAAPGSTEEGAPVPSATDDASGAHSDGKDTAEDGPEVPVPYSDEDLSQDGTPEEVEHLFKIFGQHEKQVSTPSEAVEEVLNKDAVQVALQQIDFFDSPSLRIDGVLEHRYKDDEAHRAFGYGRREVSSKGLEVPERLITGSLNRLRLVFQDNARGRKESDLRHGKVNTRRLAQRVPVGDDRVFQKKRQPGRKDYFVVVGIDCSGSTAHPYEGYGSGPRLDLMKMAVYAKAEMLSRLGVTFALYAHSGGRDMLEIFCIKTDKEPWGRDQKAALMALQPYSANLDGHTLEYYRKVCERRTETDKLILYYTDGAMPAANFEEELEILQREIKMCERLGIHLVGIGVNSDSPTEHGLDTILLDKMEDVPEVVKGLQERLAK